jgi:hypothetical protein
MNDTSYCELHFYTVAENLEEDCLATEPLPSFSVFVFFYYFCVSSREQTKRKIDQETSLTRALFKTNPPQESSNKLSLLLSGEVTF